LRYVLDCSVAVKWSIPEPLTEQASRVLDQHRAGTLTFAAPEIILAEFGHTVKKRIASRELSREAGQQIWDDFLLLPIETVPTRDIAATAFPLAVAHNATFYDALYIALAERENVHVLTADEGMAAAFAPLKRALLLRDFPG